MNIITNDEQKCALAIIALRDVIDPEIGLNIIDLGLVYQLDFDQASLKIYMQMTLTTAFCPMGEAITHSVKAVMKKAFEHVELELVLSFDPPWHAGRISESGKAFLGN